MIDRVGQQLGNYHLTRLLGQGHFAEVYLGEHVYLDTQAAIKVLLAHLSEADIAAFRAEARTLARLEHPQIVRLLEFGLEGTMPFLVMSYAPHGTLRQRHPAGTRLSLDTIVSYVKQVAAALQYAHDQRLIHRDLKPENLLLGRSHEVLLSDFGLALLLQSSYSQQGQVMAGTIAYMAPEQIRGHPSVASDQYALGTMVYEWLCGARPFAGSFAEVAAKQTLVPPPSLREQVPGIPAAVEQVVFKTLAKDPQHRFAQVRDLALALEEASKAEESGRTVIMPSLEQPAETRQTSHFNLPVPLTQFIGREQEVAAVCAELSRPEVRLLNLLGMGGVGKTRLSLEVAREMHPRFGDGVCFVPLAPIRDPDLVLPTIAQALKLQEAGGQPVLDLLKDFLRDKHLLLLLDNVEQVAAAVLHLEEVLMACPHLKLLVTSRALLHQVAEHVFPVLPLALPDLVQLPEGATYMQYAAITLFVQRARAIQPTFQLTPTNARTVAEICVRLDGLPLALELAAARIHLLSPQALLARLSHRLTVLTRGAHNLPERQQTLRHTLQWSYDLLGDSRK